MKVRLRPQEDQAESESWGCCQWSTSLGRQQLPPLAATQCGLAPMRSASWRSGSAPLGGRHLVRVQPAPGNSRGVSSTRPSGPCEVLEECAAPVSDSGADVLGVRERTSEVVADQPVRAAADEHPPMAEDPVYPLDLVALLDLVVLGPGDTPPDPGFPTSGRGGGPRAVSRQEVSRSQ